MSVVVDRVNEAHIPKRNIGSADLPFRGYECIGGAPLLSDTWPVQRHTYGYLPSRKASSRLGWYQIILVSDRGTLM